ncbi:efflux RND transporter periplasmic adaptor subunit [Oxalobacteraceae bacterium R-40]|uniref:Efflux RND transporter periplasmic adaptor subunit n=1 Tax=Keguizhuia sedimenti TaxID=3064264 RepID=A0ABU1BP18_9BURK|nr:efflux RND transporter periplasmic adaptor subunit [Oxalobacteraceae bacterium R-40]
MDTRTEQTVLSKARHRSAKPHASKKAAVIILATLVLAIIGAVLFYPDPIQAELTTVTQGPMQVTINNQGQVRAHDKYVVAAPVAARLERIELHEGDSIKKDQVLATLYAIPLDARQQQEVVARYEAAQALAREARLRAQRAQLDLRLASSERARIERLVKEKFVSPQAAEKAVSAESTSRAELNAARSREQAAIADVKAAEAALNSLPSAQGNARRPLRLTAPVNGYVLKVHEKSERTVAAGTPLITLGDPDKYEIVVDILSTDAVKVKPGNTMLLEGWGGSKTLRAKVRLVEPVAFTKISALGVEEQRVNVIADPIDPLGALGDGYRVEARIVIWSGDNVTKVAGSSLFRVGEKWHVFAVEGGRAQEWEVQIGQRNQEEAQIISGLQSGAKVIRYPSNEIEDGVRVKPRS